MTMEELTATQRRRQRRKRNKGTAGSSDDIVQEENPANSKAPDESTDCGSPTKSAPTHLSPECNNSNSHNDVLSAVAQAAEPLTLRKSILDQAVASMSINEICQNVSDALNNEEMLAPLLSNASAIESEALINTKASENNEYNSNNQPQQRHQEQQQRRSLEDYFNLPHDEFNRLWKRSLRFLKKASENFDKPPPKYYGRNNRNSNNNSNGGSSCNLTFHNKVYEDIQNNHIVYFDFFLSIERDYKSNGQEPNFDIAEQVIVVLSTLADSKPWKGAGAAGAMNEEVSDILMWAQQFLVRLQSLTNMYERDDQKDRTSTVTHTLMKQVLNFHSPRGVSVDMISYEAIGAFRMCAELELKNYVDSGEILSWIPAKQRITVGKLRDTPDDKIWKWIVRYNRTSGSRRG